MNNKEILFFEKQLNTHWMISIIAYFIGAVLIYFLHVLAFDEETFKTLYSAFSFFIFFYVLDYFFFMSRLITRVFDDYIQIKFYPYKWNMKINFEEIESWEVRKYNAIREYGGWGFSNGILKNGPCYTSKGDMGLQLIFKNGKKLLIGTQKPEELESVLKKIIK